jgi:hypothetical protein
MYMIIIQIGVLMMDTTGDRMNGQAVIDESVPETTMLSKPRKVLQKQTFVFVRFTQ